MKITITDIHGKETTFEKADINLMTTSGILTVHPNGNHAVMHTYILRNLISYVTESD